MPGSSVEWRRARRWLTRITGGRLRVPLRWRRSRFGLPSKIDVAAYSQTERLCDGRAVQICAFTTDDRAELLSAVSRASARTLYRRFFTTKRNFSERELAFFMNVDFVSHVALVVLAEEDVREVIIGGGRYVVVRPGVAEVAFVVIDQYQGKGIGAALMHHLAVIARAVGLRELIAEVLLENRPMLKVFEKCGLKMTVTFDAAVAHVVLRLD